MRRTGVRNLKKTSDYTLDRAIIVQGLERVSNVKENESQFNPPAMVEITWKDAIVNHGWSSCRDLEKEGTVNCWTSGYIVQRGEDEVWIAQSVADDGSMADVIKIPTANISELRELIRID